MQPRPEVSVAVPVYFNAESLVQLYDRIAATMSKLGVTWDVTFVDDGSEDDSRTVLNLLNEQHDNVRVVHLVRNFGSTPAILAGLSFASGRCACVISADLQDPPEALEALVNLWRGGARIAVAARESRTDPLSSRLFSAIYYLLFRWLVTTRMPKGGFDIVAMDHQVAKLLVSNAENNTNFPAALLSLGFACEAISYHRVKRPYGSSKWTFWRKYKLMYDSILSFSYRPLRIISAMGLLGLLVAFLYGIEVVWNRLTSPNDPPGWASLMVVTLFFNGLVLMSLGVIGEYVWRTFVAAQRIPAFVVERSIEPKLRGRREQADVS